MENGSTHYIVSLVFLLSIQKFLHFILHEIFLLIKKFIVKKNKNRNTCYYNFKHATARLDQSSAVLLFNYIKKANFAPIANYNLAGKNIFYCFEQFLVFKLTQAMYDHFFRSKGYQ